ncbi:unnamed protein product [Angiostrongylus costaricensis]|uniref:Uncharacterized protein n=1 Tax=Angiostrongylus costaricensis TaxID=334426 RepID=A0A0R3PNB2_ANGCS|nr:unnamed protein product [Angiostrongylus costaricensis]
MLPHYTVNSNGKKSSEWRPIDRRARHAACPSTAMPGALFLRTGPNPDALNTAPDPPGPRQVGVVPKNELRSRKA